MSQLIGDNDPASTVCRHDRRRGAGTATADDQDVGVMIDLGQVDQPRADDGPRLKQSGDALLEDVALVWADPHRLLGIGSTINELEQEMLTAANNLEFEKAALLRDQIQDARPPHY